MQRLKAFIHRKTNRQIKRKRYSSVSVQEQGKVFVSGICHVRFL